MIKILIKKFVKDYENVGIPVYEAGTLDQFAKVISKL